MQVLGVVRLDRPHLHDAPVLEDDVELVLGRVVTHADLRDARSIRFLQTGGG
jgi:hypothetical protein